jgi:hypothetical protein
VEFSELYKLMQEKFPYFGTGMFMILVFAFSFSKIRDAIMPIWKYFKIGRKSEVLEALKSGFLEDDLKGNLRVEYNKITYRDIYGIAGADELLRKKIEQLVKNRRNRTLTRNDFSKARSYFDFEDNCFFFTFKGLFWLDIVISIALTLMPLTLLGLFTYTLVTMTEPRTQNDLRLYMIIFMVTSLLVILFLQGAAKGIIAWKLPQKLIDQKEKVVVEKWQIKEYWSQIKERIKNYKSK